MDEEQKKISLRIPRDMWEELVKLAEADERSVSATIRIALREYLRRLA
jgi:hypothetical protein